MYKFKVETMTCNGCGAAITRAIQTADKNAQVKTFPERKLVEVETGLSLEQLLVVFTNAGYPAAPETRS